MKIYISADIEGVAGIISWDETSFSKPDYKPFQEQMTSEVIAACEGAIAAGAKDILVKDAHETGRNILHNRLPLCTRLHRGWSGHPFMMMDGIDGGFDAAIFIGYHARAGSGGNPLAHTMSSSKFAVMRLNGEAVSEFRLNAMAAAYCKVPMALVSGDDALCADVQAYDDGIVTVSTKSGTGAAALCRHPATIFTEIKAGAERALRRDLKKCLRPLPSRFQLEIEYRDPALAYKKSFYPGARLTDDRTLTFEATDYFDILRMMGFSG